MNIEIINKIRFRFNYDSLKDYCDNNNIDLHNDYSQDKLTRLSFIEGICSMNNCTNIFNSKLYLLFKNNFKCNKCLTSIEVEKRKKTCLEKYGCEHALQNKLISEKFKRTCITKYDSDNPMKNKLIKDKLKKTCLEKYGCEYSCKNKNVIEKRKKTCLEKYGYEHPFQNNYIKEQIKKTCLEKYGVENPFQNENIKEKIKKKCLDKYGIEHHMQIPIIAEKSSKTSYLFKKYKTPSNKEINIQGYENFALDKMFKDNIIEDDIVYLKKEVPEIWYYTNNKKHRHYVDFYIKSQNKCIEVKSIWTYEKKKIIYRLNK
jgi:hypothetical protein